MKKFFITLVFCCLGYPMLAQFVSFQSVQADPVKKTTPPPVYDPLLNFETVTIQTPPPPQQDNNYTTIAAYTIRGGQFQKIKIKILEKGSNIYVNSYYDKNTNMWYSAYNTNARPTTKSDPDIIYNNFDFKVNISGLGNVYF